MKFFDVSNLSLTFHVNFNASYLSSWCITSFFYSSWLWSTFIVIYDAVCLSLMSMSISALHVELLDVENLCLTFHVNFNALCLFSWFSTSFLTLHVSLCRFMSILTCHGNFNAPCLSVWGLYCSISDLTLHEMALHVSCFEGPWQFWLFLTSMFVVLT